MKSETYIRHSSNAFEHKIQITQRLVLSLLLFFFFLTTASAQENYTLSGVVRSQTTGEKIIGASVSIAGTTIGAISNEYGYYSLTLPQGKYTIHFSSVGFT